MTQVNTITFKYYIGQRIYRNGAAYIVVDLERFRIYAKHVLNGRGAWYPAEDFSK